MPLKAMVSSQGFGHAAKLDPEGRARSKVSLLKALFETFGQRGNSKHEAAPPPIFFLSSTEADPSCCLLWVLRTLEQGTLAWQGAVVLEGAPYSGG